MPIEYGGKRTQETTIFLTGRNRVFDTRFTTDGLRCLESALAAGQSQLVNGVGPIIDRGDPIPGWVDNELFSFLPENLSSGSRQAWAYAFLLGRQDRVLANQLRAIASITAASLLNSFPERLHRE